MSASSFNTIRRHSLDSTGVRIKEITQALAKQRSDFSSSQLETDDVRSLGRMDHSTIKLNDERLKFMTLLGSEAISYEFPTEPDFKFLKVWFMLDHLGARMRDMSGLGNDAYIQGHPTLRRSGLSLGFMQTDAAPATPTMLFNSGTDVVSAKDGEYIWIQDNPTIKFTQFATGFSLTCRFCCLDFGTHYPDPDNPNSYYARRIAAKSDDAANGWTLNVNQYGAGNTGGVYFDILHNGVTYSRLASGFTAGLWYQIVITYDPNAAQRIRIYTAGIENSSSANFNTIIPTYTNLRIGARSGTTGFFRGFIHDFRLYMGKVLTPTEITNINTNEITIDNIAKGHIFILQYATIGVAAPRRSKIHRYHVNGRITRTHTHKYTVEGRQTVLRTMTFVYDVTSQITRTHTHKFTVTGVMQAMATQYVRFAKSTGANGVTQEITFNGTPQALIVWSEGTTSDNTFNDNYHLYYGFSDGTNHACVSGYGQDAVSTSNAFSGHKNDKVISMMNTTLGTVSAEASVAFSTNKATFTWSTNDARAVYVHCLAIWGITGAEVKTFTTGQTSTGIRTYTLNNSSLVPNFIHTIQRGAAVSWSNTMGNAISIGAATSPSKQWNCGNTIMDAKAISSNYYNWSYSDTTNLLATLDDDSLTVEAKAELYSLSQGEFELNWTDAPQLSTAVFSVLCLDGDNIDVGTFAEPGATGAQDVTVDSTVDTVKGVMVFTTDRTADGGSYSAYMSVGGASGTGATEQGVVSASDQDSSSSTITARINKTGSVIRMVDPEATATSSTTPAEAAVTALGTDQFTVNWSARNSTRRNHYIVFGYTGSSTTSVSTTKTHKYNVTGKVTQQKTYKYNITGKVTHQKTHKYNIEEEGGGYTEIYNETTGTNPVSLYSDGSRVGLLINSASSSLIGQTPKKFTIYLSKTNNPTGTATLRIRNSSDSIVSDNIATINVSTLTTTPTSYDFEAPSQSHALQNGDRILLEYTGGSTIDYVRLYRTATDVVNYVNQCRYSTSYTDNTTYDWKAIIYA